MLDQCALNAIAVQGSDGIVITANLRREMRSLLGGMSLQYFLENSINLLPITATSVQSSRDLTRWVCYVGGGIKHFSYGRNCEGGVYGYKYGMSGLNREAR